MKMTSSRDRGAELLNVFTGMSVAPIIEGDTHMAKSSNVTIPEPMGKQGGTSRGGHVGANLTPPLSSDQMDTFHNVPVAQEDQFGKSWLVLNKNRVGLSLLATGLVGFMVWSRIKKPNRQNTTEAKREPAHGRLWNINLDPHESGMAT